MTASVFEIAFKAAIIGILIFQAFLILKARRDFRGWVAVGFLISVACYLLCTLKVGQVVPSVVRWTIYLGCVWAPFFFWLFSFSLFDDNFGPRFYHLPLFLFLAFESFFLHLGGVEYIAGTNKTLASLLHIIPQCVALGFVVATLIKANTGRKDDLIESRLKFRTQFTLVAGVYTLLVLVIEIRLSGSEIPDYVELMNAASIWLVAMLLGGRLFSLQQNVLPPLSLPEVVKLDLDPEEKELKVKLNSLMKTDTFYRTPELTIGTLALKLEIAEYKLRRFINGHLGYRNFNEYLNWFRVQDAEKTLRDPAKDEITILRLALDLGYGSLAPFNRAFRRQTGLTPTEYRLKRDSNIP